MSPRNSRPADCTSSQRWDSHGATTANHATEKALKTRIALNQFKRRILPFMIAAGFVAATTVSLAPSAHAAKITPPDVPADLQIPAGNNPFLLGKATGTQNYVCLPAGVDAAGNPVFAWKLFTPEATLFSDDPLDPKQLTTHFFSPNPDELNTDPLTNGHPVRATWQHSRDSSAVWARTFLAKDAAIVTAGAIPWLKLTVVGTEIGPDGGNALAKTTFIHRVNTAGGAAPAADTCDSLQEVGSQAYRPYTADYIFYTNQ